MVKLQRVHNAAARVVRRTNKYDHITPIFKGLPCLPVFQSLVQDSEFDLEGKTWPSTILHQQSCSRSCSVSNVTFKFPESPVCSDRCAFTLPPMRWLCLRSTLPLRPVINQIGRRSLWVCFGHVQTFAHSGVRCRSCRGLCLLSAFMAIALPSH